MITGNQKFGKVPGRPGPAFWITWAFGAVFAFIIVGVVTVIVGVVTVALVGWAISFLFEHMLGGL